MAKKALLCTFLCLVLVAAVQQDDSRAQVTKFREVVEKVQNSTDPDEKIKLITEYLDTTPENQFTSSVVRQATDIFINEKSDANRAESFIKGLLARFKDPKNIFEAKKHLIRVYGEQKDLAGIKSLAADLQTYPKFGYWDYRAIADAARTGEFWDYALGYYQKAVEAGSLKGLRKELGPNSRWTDEQVKGLSERRSAPALVWNGWVLAQLKRYDDAEASFKRASDIVHYSYVGVPREELNVYWGKSRFLMGNIEGAIEKLIPDAVFGGNKKAIATLKKAYASKNGNENGFTEFLKKKKAEIAKSAVDFTLDDYKGGKLTLSKLKGKVVFLTFWFPT